MKEELQGKLVEILTSIQATASRASDFAMEQLPDIAQSYVAYGRVWSTVSVCLWLAALLCSVLAMRWSVRVKDDNMEGVGQFMAGMGGGFGALLSFIFSLIAIKNAVLVWAAPKVWLLKELASLVK